MYLYLVTNKENDVPLLCHKQGKCCEYFVQIQKKELTWD